MARPYEDIRVIDLSGAFAARLFGDYGADVILVETPKATQSTDPSRSNRSH